MTSKLDSVILGSKVAVRLMSARISKVVAVGPGETTGSATIVDVEVSNGSVKPIDLGGAVANLRYGQNLVAVPGTGAPYSPFAGTLNPGKSAKATYVFRPQTTGAAPTQFVLQFSYAAGASSVQFAGTAR